MLKKLSILAIMLVSLFTGIKAGEYLTNSIFDIKLFDGFEKEEILSANIRLTRNSSEINIGEEKYEELSLILNDLIVYKKENSFVEVFPESPVINISTGEGKNIKLTLQDSLIIVNGTPYEANLESFDTLMQFADNIEREVLVANTK